MHNDKTRALADSIREKNNEIAEENRNNSGYNPPSLQSNARQFISEMVFGFEKYME